MSTQNDDRSKQSSGQTGATGANSGAGSGSASSAGTSSSAERSSSTTATQQSVGQRVKQNEVQVGTYIDANGNLHVIRSQNDLQQFQKRTDQTELRFLANEILSTDRARKIAQDQGFKVNF